MKLRFNRDYELTIQIDSIKYIIKPPLRIAFDGVKSINGGLNRLNISIFNLSEDKRRRIVKDAEESEKYFPLTFSVGYEDRIVRKFYGSIHEASSSRAGADFVTKITCIDGGHDNQFSHVSAAVTKKDDAIAEMIATLENTDRGKIESGEQTSRPIVMVGNTLQVMKKHLKDDEKLYILDGKIYIINSKQYINSAFVPVISPETGLKDTPERKSKMTSFSTIINPTVNVGQLIDLRCTTAKHLNGLYRVDTNQFKGDYEGADWIDYFECFPSADMEPLS